MAKLKSTPNQTLTSIKLDSDLYDEFKILSIRTKMTFQKVAERAMYLYVTNEDFRSEIHNCLNTSLGKQE
jgi:predicted transcriptional regulator